MSFIFCVLGIRSNWREYNYRKNSTAVKADILSIDIKPMSGKAVISINYVIAYRRDNSVDTLSYSTTQEHFTNNPLPSVEKLKANAVYVHYVPINKRNETIDKERIFINSGYELESSFHTGWFTATACILVFGYLLRPSMFGRKN
ncbi:MAG: hypothetical protein LC116_06175 [Bacteroidetes bacterium]|nr:hypothetical protein [Bacteroidota bacterium]MCZ2132766.1 hypothetical protein [Bacteroidota bacterium]